MRSRRRSRCSSDSTRFNRLNATGLVLKVGIHRGDAIVVSGRQGTDYFGQTVNIASRIGAIADPG